MEKLLSLVAFVLLIAWVAGSFILNAGPVIHILFIFALIAFLLRSLERDKA